MTDAEFAVLRDFGQSLPAKLSQVDRFFFESYRENYSALIAEIDRLRAFERDFSYDYIVVTYIMEHANRTGCKECTKLINQGEEALRIAATDQG